MKRFNEYKRLDLPELSKELLAQWEKENLFELVSFYKKDYQ